MELYYLLLCLSVALLLYIIFFLMGKNEKYESLSTTVFECGFTSYFYSRFSFSIQFFLIALIFLFFDLELCCLMPLFQEMNSDFKTMTMISLFVMILLIGLMKEIKDSKLEWAV